MTLVVVARGLDPDRPSDARRGIDELLRLSTKVLEGVQPEFTPTQIRVWEGFPGEGLGGELKFGFTPVDGERVTLANLLPSSDRRLAGDAEHPLSNQFTIQPHHALEVTGRYQFGDLPAVPAWLNLNLYRPWAMKAGDIVFDTSKTAAVQSEGLYGLLASDTVRAEPILRRLMEKVSEGSKEIGKAAKVSWAAVKETEGAEEPGFRSLLAQYRGRNEGRHALLSEALREGAAEIGDTAGRSSDSGLPAAFISAVIDDIAREIEGAPAFSPVASELENLEGITYCPAGSAYYILPDPEAVKRVADRILATLGPDISKAVQQRLRIVNSWETALSGLSKKGRAAP